jgi:adenylate cyclase
MDAALKRRCRFAILITALAPLLPQLLGSAFNIWYNALVINPLFTTDTLKQRFVTMVIVYNCIVFPLGIAVWLRLVLSLRPAFRALCAGQSVADEELTRLRRRLIHLPHWGAAISAVAWLLFIPTFFATMLSARGPLDPVLFWHLPVSILVSAAIAITHSFFLVELASHWALFPVFFRGVRVDRTPGATTISLRMRGVLWAVSAGICPIGSLLLLSFAPPAPGSDPHWFAVFVGSVGIAFGLCTAVMISRLVATPIDVLRVAAQEVARGRLDVQVSLTRADEFGVLASDFNRMIEELREKEKLRQTFGLHVGRAAAEQILARDPGLSGVEQVITVMFVDIRAFTARTAATSPPKALRDLNDFLSVMVRVVEEDHGGMINKFLGDGFMALFGVGHPGGHAEDAVAAGRSMLRTLATLNERLVREGREAMRIGIGIHTGPAIVGSIGSPERLEFTAIGNTVNLASRVEHLTKTLGVTLLITKATVEQLSTADGLQAHPSVEIRGLSERTTVYSEEKGSDRV